MATDMIARALAVKAGQGGSGSSDAVKYTSQELTTAQQMQARENLGLYRTTEESSEPIEWHTSDKEGRASFTVSSGDGTTTYYKVSDRVLSASDIIGGTFRMEVGELVYEGALDATNTAEQYGMTMSLFGVSAEAGSYVYGYYVIPESGTYFAYFSDYDVYGNVLDRLTFPSTETVHKIEEKYLPDTTATKSYVGTAINGVQAQIDALVSKSDVVDVVGTYAELQAYDTSTLANNDVVKVLSDSTHSDSRSYYRWVVTDDTGDWEYVGSESVGYTKAETDAAIAAAIGTAIGGEY